MRDSWIRRSAALLAGGLIGASLPEQARLWVFGIILLFGVRLLLWRPRDFFGRVFRPEILLLGASLMLGFGYGCLADRSLPEPLSLEHVKITGYLKNWSLLEDKGVGTLEVESAEELASQTYRLVVYADKLGNIPGEWQRVQPGDLVGFQARLERPKSLGTPGGFDLRLYDGVRGLSGTLSVQGDVELISAGTPSLTWRIREQVRNRLEAWDSGETGVLEGIFFGDSSRIPSEVQERYKVTGVLHVFAASGSNVAFVLGLSWLVLFFLPKPTRILGTIGLLLLYAALCGGNAPIVRATILGIAVLLGRLGRGRTATLRWLFFAGLGLFIYKPLIIRDIGFQLSFAAAWGIVVLTPRIFDFRFLRHFPKVLRLAIAGTLAAQAATFPLLIAAFHRLSIVGLLANIIILFVLGSVLEIGLIGVILSFSAGLSAPWFQVSLWLLQGADEVLKFLAELPYADVWILNPGIAFWLLWYGGLGIILWGKERVVFFLKSRLLCLNRVIGTKFALLMGNVLIRRLSGRWIVLGVILLCLWSPWNIQRDLVVDMIDVGQGDSILIRTPQNQALLIDAGPRTEQFDTGERIVIPFLLENRIKHLDALLITHEHQDHIGGVPAVLANIPVDWIGVPDAGERLENEEWRAGLPLVSDSKKLQRLKAGDRINLDSGAWLDVLGPSQVLNGTHSDQNNNSLVLKLNYLGQSVLLSADMEREEMEALANTGVDLENTIFKEPHHGSQYSLVTPWLNGIHPRVVLISVGRNSFGHPAPSVLEYWKERNVPVYRTDDCGTIQLRLGVQGADITVGRSL